MEPLHALMLICAALLIVTLILVFILVRIANKKPPESNNADLIQRLSEMLSQQQQLSNQDKRADLESVMTLLNNALQNSATTVTENFTSLKNDTSLTLKSIMESIERSLSSSNVSQREQGEKLLKQLSVVDQTNLSLDKLNGHVSSLENVLVNKQARGAFGEVQLEGIMKNYFHEDQFYMQHKMSNETRVDCALRLPADFLLGIDSKFPLENFIQMIESEGDTKVEEKHNKLFKTDIKKHIDDISRKYIIANQTLDYAVMFIPAETVFYEIAKNHHDLISYGQKKKVLMVSPTTIVSVLMINHGIIKDDAMRKNFGKLKTLLEGLGKDMERFFTRYQSVQQRIKQASEETDQLDTSFDKIKSKHEKITKIEL
jgi:DNA recombination protein RmuC